MASLGLLPGNEGVVEAYRGLIDWLVIDNQDGSDAELISDVQVLVTDTRIKDVDRAARLAREILEL